jgi:hypothetical protein
MPRRRHLALSNSNYTLWLFPSRRGSPLLRTRIVGLRIESSTGNSNAMSEPDTLPPDRAPAPPPSPEPRPLSAADFQAGLDALKSEIRDEMKKAIGNAAPAPPPPPLTGWAAFTQSGIFFILLGLILLLVAYWGLGIVHSTFSFVLVVLGVAILLYGSRHLVVRNRYARHGPTGIRF